MKRLFLARCLVYGSLALCLGTLMAMGRVNRPDEKTPVVARRLIVADDMVVKKNKMPMADAGWHQGVAALDQPLDVHVSDLTLAQSVSRLAHLTHLNLACYDARGVGRLSLHISGVPTWQAMDALARACGGSWHRDGDLFTLQVDVA